MINFDNFDPSQIKSSFVVMVPQRYLRKDDYDLSAENKLENIPDSIPTTLPFRNEKESILNMREKLLRKRAELSDCWFLSCRKSKINAIKCIDKKLDELEMRLFSMQKDEFENMIGHTKKIISNADALLLRINS
jgi:hypothetical protein